MSEHTWKIEKNLCRCCHSEGAFTNLAEPCLNLGEEEIFSQMLLESLDVNVAPVTGPLCEVTYTICDGCIQRLRDACYFKRQVVQCEKRFHDMYSKNFIKFDSCYEVKVETPDSDDDDMKLEMFEEEDDFALKSDDDEKKLVVHIEVEEDTPKPKRKVAPKRKVKNTKVISKLRKKLVKAEAPAKAKDEADGDAEESAEGDGAKQRKEKKGSKITKFKLSKKDYTLVGDKWQCVLCAEQYTRKDTLKTHVSKKHYNIPKFCCPSCDEQFMFRAPFVKHKLEAHGIDDRFKCNACGRSFNEKTRLCQHIKYYHMMGKKRKCDLCDFEAFDPTLMRRHGFQHKDKNFQCRFCKKAFKRPATVKLHERIHTEDKRFVCSVCERTFVQKASLNYHMLKYHPEVHF